MERAPVRNLRQRTAGVAAGLLLAAACASETETSSTTQAEGGRWCPGSAHHRRNGNPEGLPEADKIDRAYVELVLAQGQSQIKRQFPGVRSIEIEETVGNVWRRNEAGVPVVEHAATRYQLLVLLEDPVDCPDEPAFFEGVPLNFSVDRRNPLTRGRLARHILSQERRVSRYIRSRSCRNEEITWARVRSHRTRPAPNGMTLGHSRLLGCVGAGHLG